MKTQALLLVSFALVSCEPLMLERMQQEEAYEAKIRFAQDPQKVNLPSKVSWAEKRGFADMNCDGIEDMIEIKRRKVESGFFGRRAYTIRSFEGYNAQGTLKFKEDYTEAPLPLGREWVDYLKIDTAYINDDQCADVVFSTYDTRDEQVFLAIAINQGDYSFSSEYKSIELTGQLDQVSGQLIRDELDHVNESIMYGVIMGMAFNSALMGVTMGMNIYSSDDGPTFYDYIKMDWSDHDGDGLDDFALFVDRHRRSNDLEVVVFYNSGTSDENFFYFDQVKKSVLPGFMMSRHTIASIDAEDYDGDGKADAFLRYYGNSHIEGEGYSNYISPIRVTANKEWREQKSSVLLNPRDRDTFSSATKYDSLDMNFDNKADVVFITESDDLPVIYIWHAR